MKFSKKAKGGFTLIEVMVAVGIIAVSLTALIGLLAAILDNTKQIENQTAAISISSALESLIKQKSFNEVYEKMSRMEEPYVVYFWNQFQNPDDVDNSSMVLMSSEHPGKTPGQPPSIDDLKNSEGDIFRVVITPYQAGLDGEYLNGAIESEAYTAGSPLPLDPSDYIMFFLPLNLKIYADPRNDIIEGAGTEEVNEQRIVLSDMIIVKTR